MPMGFAENFEDLQIWRRSRGLTNEVYDAFEKIRDFEFLSQIQSATVSVMNNIAEGFEQQTKKDFAHFLDLLVRPAKFVPCSIWPKTAAT